MRIEHFIVAFIAIWAIVAIARAANRNQQDRERPSWAVRAWNAAGGPQVEANRLLPATAELVGRGAGAGVRKVRDLVTGGSAERAETSQARRERAAELADKARGAAAQRGQAVVEAAERRWGARPADGRPLFARRDRPGGDQSNQRDRASAGAGADDAAGAARAPGGTGPAASQGSVQAGAAPTGDGEPASAVPASQPRWRRLRRFVWWRDRDSSGTAPAGAPNGVPGGGTLPRLAHDTTCRTCGTTHSVTLAAGENAGEVLCGCRTRLIIFRDLKGQAPPTTDPDAWIAWQTLVAAEDGYCTSIKCTGNGTYVEAGPGGVRRTPCPTCTTNGATTGAGTPTLRVVPKEDTDMTAPTTEQTAQPAPGVEEAHAQALRTMAPADWAGLAARIQNFDPESDADLINFMTGEVAGICGYAEAYEALHGGCVDSIGLDPAAVQGLGEFAEHVMELTRAMTAAHRQFVTTYQEVLNAVANGVVLPYNGRWITGEAV
ncbi:hypothetical protein AB0C27_53785 [Nonomuraea sp. NPDC048882]|uniref:hypothetical protein n=1 Tax=Nonomuraea sp. NPDC048882 TaxID=3154347 RepID=UPI0033E15B16